MLLATKLQIPFSYYSGMDGIMSLEVLYRKGRNSNKVC